MRYELKLKLFPYVIGLIILSLAIWVLWDISKDKKEREEIYEHLRTGVFIQENSVKAIAPVYYILDDGIMGSLGIIEDNSVKAVKIPFYERVVEPDEMISMIIWCESRGDPTAKNPSSTAYGLCQILDGTWKYVQNKWDMKLDRDNPDDQLYACKRLYEEEGIGHWSAIKQCLNNYDN